MRLHLAPGGASMPRPDLLIHVEALPQIIPDPSGLLLRPDTLYTNSKGEEKRGLHKSADKLLAKLCAPLLRLLQKDEAVLFVCRAQAPLGPLEQFLGGMHTHYQGTSVLVFTNKRLLHFLVKSNGDWKRMLRQLAWGAVAGAEVKGFLGKKLELRYRNGVTESYWKLKNSDASKIQVLLRPLLEASAGEANASQGVASICPECFAPLTLKVYTCPQCGLPFKDEKTLMWRAILIPGGGLFYTDQWLLGTLSAIYETFAMVMFVVYLLAAAGVLTLSDPGQPPQTQNDLLAASVGMLQALAIEKLVHWYHSLRVVRNFSPLARRQPEGFATIGSGMR